MKRPLHADGQDHVLFGRMFPYGFPGDFLRNRKAAAEVTADNNFWLMCDDCQRWRLVRADLYERFAKMDRFSCSVLFGTSCEDPDDWENVTKATTGPQGTQGDSPIMQPRGAADEDPVNHSKPRRAYRRQIRRPFVASGKRKPNLFASTAIPGFAAPQDAVPGDE
jgi:hypothetical protein